MKLGSRLCALAALSLLAAGPALAADAPQAAGAAGYRMPPAPIPAMIDAAPTPAVSLSHDRKRLAILGRENLPSVAALARPILRLAGWRIDPRTDGPAEIRMNWLTSLSLEDVSTGAVHEVALPKGLRFTAATWSPDDRRLAFVAQAPDGLELWVADADSATARRLTPPVVSAAFGFKLHWTPDGRAILFLQTPPGRGAPPAADETPLGPNIQESIGHAKPAPTFEDLLTTPHDEALFDYYFTAELARVDLDGGTVHAIGEPGVISDFALSPDGRYILVERLHRPYSYTVPSERFPTEISVLDAEGRLVHTLVDRPIADDLPIAFDAVSKGPRDVSWRADAPATLVWAEAQDGGDPAAQVEIRDRVLMLDAPFTGPAGTLVELKARYHGIDWGRSNVAVVTSRWWKTRHETRTVVDPAGAAAPRVIVERNYQDQYADPGEPLTRTGTYGQPVIAFSADGAGLLMAGAGASREGEHPFLARMDLATGAETRLWTSQDPYYETVAAVLDDHGARLLTRRESRTDPPNYFVRKMDDAGAARALTRFPDPEPQFAAVTKQLVVYKRADGVNLSGTLYLPAGYDKAKDGPLPMLMWAYPTEYTDASVAGQIVDKTKNRFVRPQGISHLFLLTQGYAIFDGFAAPIIGENGAQPNDSYIEQLVADAKAAVDAVVAMGVADRNRIAVGGHSYGAFMTANLLAHSDLFKAGIARSGAYNRTLTPFGFQAEERTFWQAEDTYMKMSPFAYAPQIKAPILLIHGEADDNTGTFPIQSERLYAALKGAGATVRYVTLPNEPHGYRGRESTLHVLWEMNDWLDRWVKTAPASAAPTPAEAAK